MLINIRQVSVVSFFLLASLVQADDEKHREDDDSHTGLEFQDVGLRFCSGTSNGYSKPGYARTARGLYETWKKIYGNCTRVYGNLEITHYDGDKKLDFFDTITEIKGYLLIYDNNLTKIELPNLEIIWGDNKLEDLFSMTIHSNRKLRAVSMPKLRMIYSGDVQIRMNPRLCYVNNTIDWTEIEKGPGELNLHIEETPESCEEKCHENCVHPRFNDESYCWGPGEEDCQTMYRSTCTALTCGTQSSGCYQDSVTKGFYCCHYECAAGCFGPGPDQCHYCKAKEEDGKCVQQCTALTTYNRTIGLVVPNPKGYYTDDRYCVKQCQANKLIEGEHCVLHCSPGSFYEYSEDGVKECKKCPNGECPKSCTLDEDITGDNIHDLVNCTIIDGYIRLRQRAFESRKRRPLKDEDLKNLLSVRRVTQYVDIAGTNLVNLTFLRNLEVIEGRQLAGSKHALVISSNHNLDEISLASLRRIQKGDVLVSSNSFLCFTNEKTFEEIATGKVRVETRHGQKYCDVRGHVCDPLCESSVGCWGPGPKNCRKCKSFFMDDQCVEQCPDIGYRVDNTTCRQCHPECQTCHGDSDTECVKCRHVGVPTDTGAIKCVETCPLGSYANEKDICVPCHEACSPHGCTGKSQFNGTNGCNRCTYAIMVMDRERCLAGVKGGSKNVCQQNNYDAFYLRVIGDTMMCQPCSTECSSCTSFGDMEIESGCQCRNYRILNERNQYRCVSECEKFNGFKLSTSAKECGRCDPRCDGQHGCTGPSNSDCLVQCHNATVFDEGGAMVCHDECPVEKPYYEKETRRCHARDLSKIKFWRTTLSIGGTIFLLILVALALCFCIRYRNDLEKEKIMNNPTMIMEMQIDPAAKPNMSKINLIRANELVHKGKILGEGAFGVVYAGYYTTCNKKVPVAIKVIKHQEKDYDPMKATASRPQEEKDMLDEATKMAMLRHPHLLPWLGISFANEDLKLVTILRPLGNLLGFLKKHKQHLGGKDLLTYCYQIASAMKYLYEKRIIHRDLATRNVLVRNKGYVEVTDFGLSKLVDYGNTEVQVKTGKVPVKWLAPECLEYSVYTHASDVWAYGVTCWEILTYGQSPYQGMDLYKIRESIITNGSRLEQPNNCSTDLYSTLLRCWMSNPESRPTFVTLEEDFLKYCRAPRLFVLNQDTPLAMSNGPSQMQLIQEILEETDAVFEDPLEYGNDMTGDGTGAINAASRMRRLTSTNSQRYQTDPLISNFVREESFEKPSTPQQVQMDDGNYLMPNNRQEPGGVLYTAVINDRGDPELASTDSGYYNEAVSGRDYYNDIGKQKKLDTIREQENAENAEREFREVESVL